MEVGPTSFAVAYSLDSLLHVYILLLQRGGGLGAVFLVCSSTPEAFVRATDHLSPLLPFIVNCWLCVCVSVDIEDCVYTAQSMHNSIYIASGVLNDGTGSGTSFPHGWKPMCMCLCAAIHAECFTFHPAYNVCMFLSSL